MQKSAQLLKKKIHATVKLKRSFKINKQKQITRLNQRNKIIVTSMTSETMIDSGDEQETSEI